MSDIRTAETIVIGGEYRVTVADAGDQWEAAVTATKSTPLGRALRNLASGGTDTSEWADERDAPRVYGDGKYTAVGEAVEAYLEQFEEDDADADE